MDLQKKRHWIVLGFSSVVALLLIGLWVTLPTETSRPDALSAPPAVEARLQSGERVSTTPALAQPRPPTPKTAKTSRGKSVGHTVKGRVFDEASGAGIGSARITFHESHVDYIESIGSKPTVVTSKDDGSFVLEGVPAANITLTVNAKQYATREVEVVVDERTAPVSIALSPGGSISGYLTAVDGSPVAGSASLTNVDQRIGFDQPTSAAGEFSFAQLPAGRYVIAGRLERASVSREIQLAHNERVEGVMLTLGKGRRVRGFVRGMPPERLKEILVLLRSESQKHNAGSEVDDRGAYAITGVPPGRTHLQAHLQTERSRSLIVDVPADSDLVVDIEFPRGFRLSGNVTQAGRPASDVDLNAWPVEDQGNMSGAKTSATGTYEIENLVAGRYRVGISAGAGVAREVVVSADTVFDIELPSTQLGGHVLDDASAEPIAGVGVHIVGARNDPWVRHYAQSDASGGFHVTGFDPSDIVISVYKPGYEMLRERVLNGSLDTDMAFRLHRNGGVEIRLQGADGGPVPRNIFMRETIDGNDGISLWVRLDESGRATIPAALEGSALSFSASGYVPAKVEDWDARPLDLRLEKRGVTP